MADNIFRLKAACLLPAVIMVTAFQISCDNRRVTGPNNNQPAVGSINLTLTPNQIRLSSPEAIDSVLIGILVLDSMGVGMPNIEVTLTQTPAIGRIIQPDSTDSQGRSFTYFVAAPGVYDSTRINVTAGNKSNSALLYVSGLSSYNFTLRCFGYNPKPLDSEGRPCTIFAILTDSLGNGVPGRLVAFETISGIGRIEYSDSTIPVTDTYGQAIALFYNTVADEALFFDHADIQAVTTSPDGQGFLMASIAVPQVPAHNTLTLQILPEEIVGDPDFHASLVAYLVDNYNNPMADKKIIFSWPSPDGTILDSGYTYSSGVALGYFTPYGQVSQPETVRVMAEYRPGVAQGACATANVCVIPARNRPQITITLQKEYLVAGGMDTTSIFITAQDSSGASVPDGTVIQVRHSGIGWLVVTEVAIYNGWARTKLTSPVNFIDAPHVDSIFAWFNPVDSVVVADTAVVHYIPGPISLIDLVYPETTVTLFAGSGDTCSVIFSITDANGNPIGGGTQIGCRNLLPTSILYPSPNPPEDGFFTIIYQVGDETGDDYVWAFLPNPGNPNDTIRTIHPAHFHCIAGEPNDRLVLSATDDTIEVGGHNAIITATIENYRPPPFEGPMVAFEIIPPIGASFDSLLDVYRDTVETNINGQALVRLFSRAQSRPLTIRACTVAQPPESLYICDEMPMFISPGPPANIQTAFNYSGEATNPNMPERFVQAVALVSDQFRNPVAYGTRVYFSLIPDSLAIIDDLSYTGLPSPYHPDSAEGVAYSRITYICSNTFDFLQVVASSGNAADTSVRFSLPIYEGSLVLTAEPESLWTADSTCLSRDTSFIAVTLTDGGGCPIEGGIINFSTLVAGQILGQTIDTTDIGGHAETRFMIRGCEIPRGPNGRCFIEGRVRATLGQDSEVTGQVNIGCYRQ